MSDQESNSADETGLSVLDTIRKIRSKEIDPKSLSIEDRRVCVQHLGAEGLAVPEIAQVLGCSDRTIARDRKALQEELALAADPALAEQLAGTVLAEANNSRMRIARITRDKEASHAVRIEGERVSFDILNRAIERLQKLGVLPQAATQIQADLHHSAAAPPSYDELIGEVDTLIQLQEQHGEVPDSLRELRDEANREKLASKLLLSSSDPDSSPANEESKTDETPV